MKKNLLIFAAVMLSIPVTAGVQAQPRNPQISTGSSLRQEIQKKILQQEQIAPKTNSNLTKTSNNQGRMLMQPGFRRSENKNFVPQRQEFRQKMLQMFDANHDGKIDENERMQMRQARQQRRSFEQPEQQSPNSNSLRKGLIPPPKRQQ